MALLVEADIGQTLDLVVETADAGVDFSFGEPAQDTARFFHLDLDADAGGLVVQPVDHLGQPEFRIGGDTIDDGDLQLADEAALQRRQRHRVMVDPPQQVDGDLMHLPALVGELEAAPAALAEDDPEPRFQGGDVVGNGRLAEAQFGLRCRKAAVADDGIEHGQKMQIGA